MGSKLKVIVIVGLTGLVVLGYQNCAPQNETTSLASATSACQGVLSSKFEARYYPFLKTNCGACHASGPGNGFFASNDSALSLSAFLTKTEAKIAEFAVSTHKLPYTGTQHTASVAALRTDWQSAEDAYNSCMNSVGVTPGGGGSTTPTPTPSKMLVAKSANPANNQTVNLTWNTGSDFEDSANAFPGGSLVVTVRAVTVGAITAYQFENLRFINQSGASAFVKSLNIYVNDTLVDGETFLYVERYVPNVANNNSRRLAPGAAFFASPIGQAIQVKIAVNQLKAADIDFRPTTYAALTATGGTFQTSCQSCHGTSSGGFSLAANSYNNIVGRNGLSNLTLISPYNLGDSLIYQRMNSAGAPMPQTGLLGQDPRDRIRDWILDGAPLNDAAIAR